jgi:hypothetical protein
MQYNRIFAVRIGILQRSLVQSLVQIKLQRTHVQAREGSYAEKGVCNGSVDSHNVYRVPIDRKVPDLILQH